MSQQKSPREFMKIGAGLGIGYWIAGGIGTQEGGSPCQAAAEKASATKVFIMTDMEGVAGVLDFDNWCTPESRYYDLGKEFLTLEVNAAIEGFARGGATEFLVADGHGHGGINPKLLDPRAELARSWAPHSYPFSLEKGFAFAAWVGQHAMSRSEYAACGTPEASASSRSPSTASPWASSAKSPRAPASWAFAPSSAAATWRSARRLKHWCRQWRRSPSNGAQRRAGETSVTPISMPNATWRPSIASQSGPES